MIIFGPPPVNYLWEATKTDLNPKSQVFMIIGIDIGGSKIRGVVFSKNRVLKFLEIETPRSKSSFQKQLLKLLQALATENQIYAIASRKLKIRMIGLGIAGQIDPKTLKIINSPNLKFLNGFKIGSWFKKEFGFPVRIDNDARCFLRVEAKLGAARGYKNLVGLTLGTGVGGAIIVNDQMIYGTDFSAGEIGHSFLQFPFTFEELVSQKFIKKRAKTTPDRLWQKAKSGDKMAKTIFLEYGRNLGRGLAEITNILNPEAIILGGGILKARKFFLAEAKREMKKWVVNPRAKNTKILVGQLGRPAGAIGAALYAQTMR